jgi:hypothetical protein
MNPTKIIKIKKKKYCTVAGHIVYQFVVLCVGFGTYVSDNAGISNGTELTKLGL